uniref:RING-type domain-containing protein n=1 Tax=Odontella aurita TaxID=265563 RepID=A0A7S4K4B4_9STRA|mmetsp:Transcript_61230/g.181093  ORF Transcript_61230/g.181093 Transcript_61230/m.181093 type:complete len:386 (+) Transcript_61230:231-1388(+)
MSEESEVTQQRLQPPRNGSAASLLRILEDGVRSHALTKSDTLPVYTGFADFSALLAGGGFVPMNGNRAVNPFVVASRVEDNLRRLRDGRSLADFGQIILVVVENGPSEWLVMDGQHRLGTMRTLLLEHQVDVHFQFRAELARDEAEAHEKLVLYQDQYAPDSRTFLASRAQTRVAERVLERLREEFPCRELWSAEKPPTERRPRPGLRSGDPDRPYLTDNILLGVLGGSGLLRDGATVEGVLGHFLVANDVLKERGRAGTRSLGPGVTARMRDRAASFECYLGFLRETKLDYEDVRADVEERIAAAIAKHDAAANAADEGRKRKRNARQDDDCQICLDSPRTHLFLPCGHRCACSKCADAIITAGSKPLCPICRTEITGTLQVYD